MLEIIVYGPDCECPSCKAQYTELWILQRIKDTHKNTLECEYVCTECGSMLTVFYAQKPSMSFYDIETSKERTI